MPRRAFVCLTRARDRARSARVQIDVGDVRVTNQVESLAAGVLVASGCTVSLASEGLASEVRGAVRASAVRTDTEALRGAVRDLLRHGSYKPTGRGKPASEYLVKAATEGRFPAINNLVDINNLVSLSSLLPISLVDLDRAGERRFVLRRGRPDESYVFNAGGQEIALRDLLLVATEEHDLACANPVKDSMATKLQEDSRAVMAVIYAPIDLRARAAEALEQFRRLVEDHASPSAIHTGMC